MRNDGVVARAAYMLGRVARGATNAVSLPYRAIAGTGTEPVRLTRRSPPAAPARRPHARRPEMPLPDVPLEAAEIGGPELAAALDDGDADVRITAAMALEELTGIGVDLGALDDVDYRRDKVAELERWWKRRRLDQLAEEQQP